MFKRLRCWWRGYHNEIIETVRWDIRDDFDDGTRHYVATGKCHCGATRTHRYLGAYRPGGIIEMWWPYRNE